MPVRRAVNVPVHLVECLEHHKQQWQREPLLVHISTDQVYSGLRQLWQEDDACAPVNVYGSTKREAEVLIQVLCHRFCYITEPGQTFGDHFS